MSLLSAIPAELITAGFSAGLAFLGSVVAMKMKQKAAEQRMLIGRMQAEDASHRSAEMNDNPGKRWTRRVIALTATFSILVLPMVAGWVGVDIITGWTELKGGFWPFTDAHSKMVWHTVSGGIVITPLHTHTLSAIIGFYFGGSIVENARPR